MYLGIIWKQPLSLGPPLQQQTQLLGVFWWTIKPLSALSGFLLLSLSNNDIDISLPHQHVHSSCDETDCYLSTKQYGLCYNISIWEKVWWCKQQSTWFSFDLGSSCSDLWRIFFLLLFVELGLGKMIHPQAWCTLTGSKLTMCRYTVFGFFFSLKDECEALIFYQQRHGAIETKGGCRMDWEGWKQYVFLHIRIFLPKALTQCRW